MTTVDLEFRPDMKKKLVNSQKLVLMGLAARKFIDQPLRDAEEAARASLALSICNDINGIGTAEINVLKKHGLIKNIGKFSLPGSVSYTSGTKEFTHDDGTVVSRPETVSVNRVQDTKRPCVFTDLNSVKSFWANGGTPAGRHDSYAGRVEYELGMTLVCPSSYNYSDNLSLEHDKNMGLKYDNCMGFRFSDKTNDLLIALFIAAKDRAATEYQLVSAITKFIFAADYYSQIVEFWPEANDVIDDLFASRIKPSLALVAISQEDKVALCNAMGRRGVGSNYCQAMIDPALVQQAAE